MSNPRSVGPWTAAFLLAVSPLLAACGSMSDINLKDAQWFSGSQILGTSRALSIDQPPLSPDRPVTSDQLITADGGCPGLGPADAQALAGSDQPAAAPGGKVALGLPECEVARGIGVPDSVNISNDSGQRVVVLTYVRGSRPGIYRFVGGRLASIERGAEPAPEPKRQAKPKKRAAT